MTPRHKITLSEKHTRIVESGRALIEQKVSRRDDAIASMNEAMQALDDARESADMDRVRLAKDVLQHRVESVEHAELVLDAAFLELALDFVAEARAEIAQEQNITAA